ncbi:hypothetical protein GGI07_005714 [Coemansia sp. Benny D115]|nr:hypothetical protein GGI07_005714 [Coemansia sp. Benny D115]
MAEVQPYDIDALQVNPAPVLDNCSERLACAGCGKKTKFFCYFCCQPVPQLRDQIPRIRLPFKMDVIKHAKELDGKSTALHAKIVAPEDVNIVTYSPSCLDGVDPLRTALLFPGPDAVDIATLDPQSFDKVIVIDGTWSQAKGMLHHNTKLRLMQKVTVKPRKTRFWRYQSLDDSYMATIEAIYFLYRDSFGPGYAGEYDALMYFYKYFYDFIQNEYKNDPSKKYHSKQRNGYITYDSGNGTGGSGNGDVPKREKHDTRTKINYEFGDLQLDSVFETGETSEPSREST